MSRNLPQRSDHIIDVTIVETGSHEEIDSTPHDSLAIWATSLFVVDRGISTVVQGKAAVPVEIGFYEKRIPVEWAFANLSTTEAASSSAGLLSNGVLR